MLVAAPKRTHTRTTRLTILLESVRPSGLWTAKLARPGPLTHVVAVDTSIIGVLSEGS